MRSTDDAYADRLTSISGRPWKRYVPNPYRWNIRRLCTGRVLDVGCGVGRCLTFLGERAVGVDPNAAAVATAVAAGHSAYTPAEFTDLPRVSFDTLLCSHVIEHLDEEEATAMLRGWLAWLSPGGRVVVIVPQERGQRSDPTHVRFVDEPALRQLAADLGLTVPRVRSFPFPRFAGRWWIYNETVLVAER
jgi:2-polyprenyl-3-methyl-5-hydroxy-6-metoxy-1,4-benzoquinol methylase